jgi:hypothetical protein
VTGIDAHGYVWLAGDALSSGWFCVQPADVQVVQESA